MPSLDPSGIMQDGHASRFAIARFLAGDLSDAERSAVQVHTRSCDRCGRALREAELAASSFAAKFPTLEYLDAVQRARKGMDRSARPAFGLGGVWGRLFGTLQAAGPLRSALAALIVLGAAGSLVWFQPAGRQSDLTSKGFADKEAVSFYLAVNGKPEKKDTLAVAAGDTLQLGVQSPAPVHYALLYRDDGGEILAYLAADDRGLPPLGGPKGENLPHSLVLDDTWAREELFALWSYQPFTFEEARALAAGHLGSGTAAPRGDIRLKTWILIQIRGQTLR